jgi:hypothetical protein
MTANSPLNEVVSGARTTVPTDATTVELNVEAGGTTSGIMNFHPTGNPAGGSGQSLEWSAGGTDSQTIQENVGASDELDFALTGGTAKVTATIVGYSTQVTDGDVSGLDGASGQVLTDNGTGGAAWATPSVGAGGISPTGGTAGQVLTNTRSGVAWSAVSTPLTWTAITGLQDGCTTNPAAGGAGVATTASGVVYLRGSIQCASNENDAALTLFTLPTALWPTQQEYVTVDLYNGQTGRLVIQTNGSVLVEQNLGAPTTDSPLAFISLDGLMYTLPY